MNIENDELFKEEGEEMGLTQQMKAAQVQSVKSAPLSDGDKKKRKLILIVIMIITSITR